MFIYVCEELALTWTNYLWIIVPVKPVCRRNNHPNEVWTVLRLVSLCVGVGWCGGTHRSWEVVVGGCNPAPCDSADQRFSHDRLRGRSRRSFAGPATQHHRHPAGPRPILRNYEVQPRPFQRNGGRETLERSSTRKATSITLVDTIYFPIVSYIKDVIEQQRNYIDYTRKYWTFFSWEE